MFDEFGTMSTDEKLNWLVHPRDDWFGRREVAVALKNTLLYFNDLGVELPGGADLARVCANDSLSEFPDAPSRTHRGIRGLMQDNPQHAAFYALGEREFVRPEIWQLVCLILITISQWESRLASMEMPQREIRKFQRRRADVWRPVRLIETPGIDLLPQMTGDPAEFSESLGDVISELDPRKIDEMGQNSRYLVEIHRFFKYFLGGGRDVYTRVGRVHSTLDVEPRTARVNGCATDPDSEFVTDVSESIVMGQRAKSQLQTTEHFQHGNSPDEIEDAPRLIASKKTIDLTHGGTPVSAAIRQANRKIFQKRAAQMLPGRWDTLTETELRVLLLAVFESTFDSPDTAVILALVLLTGRSISSVISTRLVRNRSQIPKSKLDPTAIYIVATTTDVVVGVPAPETRRKAKKSWRRVLVTHEGALCLPVSQRFWSVLKPLVAVRLAHVKKRSVALFVRNSAPEYEQQVRSAIAEINRGRRGRFTLNRISYQLTEELHRTSGDLISATMITGQSLPFGTSAALYYHHARHQVLVEHYLIVMEHWESLVCAVSQNDDSYQADLLTGTAGSDLVPETEPIAGMFRALNEQVLNDRMLMGTAAGLRHFHNSLTNYTVMMIFWLTGYRAVHDPVGEATEYNKRRRLLVINDKTGGSQGHSRMVPVADVLAAQLNQYQTHTDWLRNRLSLFNKKTVGTQLFYIDDSWAEVPVHPASINRFIEWAYVLPLNLSRHWLRGHLITLGVPGPHVDRFMGHWSLGQEPWTRYSAVQPMGFHSTVLSALNHLARELELSVVEGIA